jgi:outer membrane receptor for ferric coprogen and ferric-rhodotorulic acid
MKYVYLMSAAALAVAAVAAQPALASEKSDESASGSASAATIIVTGGQYSEQPSGATTLPISIADTPQSVTVINRDYLDDFGFDDINDVLRLVTGVNVERAESDRTYYNSRGFDIKAMKVDGLGLPNIWGVYAGQLDTAVFDRIEVVRGANGLLSGTGNPSGTVNYLRKRPTGERRLFGELSAGSWNRNRAEADVEIPLAADGRWSVRAVGAAQSNDSYLRDYQQKRTVFQGILSGELTDSLGLVLGYTRQDTHAESPLWGALPLLYTDGTQTDFPVSTSTAQEWAYWDTHDATAFGELHWDFAKDWSFKTSITRKVYSEPSRLFYVYGTPDPVTGLGLYGYPGGYYQTNDGWIADAEVVGKLHAFGREHEVTFGTQYVDSNLHYLTYPVDFSDPAWGPLPALHNWTGQEVAMPAFGAPYESSDVDYRIWRIYGAMRVAVTDRLKLIGGFNYIDVRSSGISFDVDYSRAEKALSPYVGATYEIAPQVNIYASYSDLFEPQSERGLDRLPLGSAKGQSFEGGMKGNFLGGKLFGSLALFSSKQSNIPEAADFVPSYGTLYRGITVKSRGIELEFGGKLSNSLSVQGGVAHLFSLQNDAGDRARTYTPKTTANLSVRWKVLPALTLGTAIRWQDDIHLVNAVGTIRQGSYATVQLHGRYDLSEHLALTVNLGNVTNHKHVQSLYWDQSYYAAPRNVTAALQWRF